MANLQCRIIGTNRVFGRLQYDPPNPERVILSSHCRDSQFLNVGSVSLSGGFHSLGIPIVGKLLTVGSFSVSGGSHVGSF